MSIERRRLMLAYGATLRSHPAREGHEGRHRAGARRSSPRRPGAWMPQQFENPANIDVHVRTTAQEILADFADAPHRCADHRRRHRRPHHRRAREVLKKEWPKPEGLRGRADRFAGHLRRPARAAPDPGHRRRLHPGQPPHRAARRRDPGRCRRCQGNGAPLGHARKGMLVGISSGATLAGDRAEAAGTAGGQPRARLQLRHRRALSVGARFPADRVTGAGTRVITAIWRDADPEWQHRGPSPDDTNSVCRVHGRCRGDGYRESRRASSRRGMAPRSGRHGARR